MTSYDYYQQLFQELPGYQPAGFEPPASDMDMFTGAFQQMQKQTQQPQEQATTEVQEPQEQPLTKHEQQQSQGLQNILKGFAGSTLNPQNINTLERILGGSNISSKILDPFKQSLEEYTSQEGYQELAKAQSGDIRKYGQAGYGAVSEAYGSAFGTFGDVYKDWY